MILRRQFVYYVVIFLTLITTNIIKSEEIIDSNQNETLKMDINLQFNENISTSLDIDDITNQSYILDPPRKRRRPGLRKRKRRPHLQQQEPIDDTNWPSKSENDTDLFKLEEQQKDIFNIDNNNNNQYQPRYENGNRIRKYRKPNQSQSQVNEPEDDCCETETPILIPQQLQQQQHNIPFSPIDRERKISDIREQKQREHQQYNSDDSYDKSYRRPYSIAKKLVGKEENDMEKLMTPHSMNSASELKNILKQAGGLSLSEILQQRNLSLDDLLRGKPVALAAISSQPTPTKLIEISTTITQTEVNSELNDFKTVPIYSTQSYSIKTKDLNDTKQKYKSANLYTEDVPTEIKSEQVNRISPTIPNERFPLRNMNRLRPIKEVIPAIRPDLSNANTKTEQMYSSGKLKKFPLLRIRTINDTIEKTKSVNTTVRLPPRYKSNEIKEKQQSKINPVTISNDETEIDITEIYREISYQITDQPITISSTTQTNVNLFTSHKDFKNRSSLRPKLRFNINRTKPKLNGEINDHIENTTEHLKIVSEFLPDVEIKNEEVQIEEINKHLSDIDSFEDKKSIDISPIEKRFELADNNHDETTFTLNMRQNTQRSFTEHKNDVTEKNPSLFADITSVKSVDDKTDLLELMEDRRSGARLAKVLAQRNMTLDELVDHRKRGSSQLHLAEIFNKSQEIYIHEKIGTIPAFDAFPLLNLGNVNGLKPDDIKTDSQGSSYFTSIISIKPTDEIFKNDEIPIKNPYVIKTIPIQTQLQKQSKQSTTWNIFSDTFDEENIIPKFAASTNKNIENTMQSDIDTIENELSLANKLMDMNIIELNTLKRNSVTIEDATMPIGIRSAIVASSCIVVISVIIFVIIFVACRWRQKRKNKFNYREKFAAIRGRLPIIQTDNTPRRSTSPIIYPSQSRCNKLNTMDPNSPEVQEYLYDMRGPFQ